MHLGSGLSLCPREGGLTDFITERAPDRKYFTVVPNLVDEIGVSVYGYRLYAHLKRVAGEDGSCWQSTRTLAAGCKMSAGQIVKAKIELVKEHLITIEARKNEHGGRDYHIIRIEDIWSRNVEYCSALKGPKPEAVAEAPPCSPDEVASSPPELARSPDELASAYSELTSSPGEIKKNPLRRTHEEEPEKKSKDLEASASKSSPKPIPKATFQLWSEADLFFFEQTGRRRYKFVAEQDTVREMVEKHGLQEFKIAVVKACKAGIGTLAYVGGILRNNGVKRVAIEKTRGSPEPERDSEEYYERHKYDNLPVMRD